MSDAFDVPTELDEVVVLAPGSTVSVDNFPDPQNVNLVTPNSVNEYSELLVPYATVTTVLMYTVPISTSFLIKQVNGWGDTNGEFLIKVDGTVVGGGRTTAADPNFLGNYLSAPITATTGQLVTITAEHYNMTSHIMKANLMGSLG